MTEDEITRSLQAEPIEPSAAFQARVMIRIHEEATAPPPIPFPWWRGLWIALALAAGLAAPIVRPETSMGHLASKWMWCLGASAGSVVIVFAVRRFSRLD